MSANRCPAMGPHDLTPCRNHSQDAKHPVCSNCGQWQHWPAGDCLHECARRELAHYSTRLCKDCRERPTVSVNLTISIPPGSLAPDAPQEIVGRIDRLCSACLFRVYGIATPWGVES